MKKTLVLSILGLTVAAVSSYGQGATAFDTYDANGGAGIITTFGDGPSVGAGLDDTFTGELLYSTTAFTDSATTSPATAALPLNPLLSVGSTGTFATGAASAGYVIGPNFNFTGTGTTLYAEIAAFNGASYGVAGAFSGHSAEFQITLVTGTTFPSADQLDGMAPFSAYLVPTPEPTTLALGGLGALSLLAFRRRKV
jgi:hypothetical protein